MIRQQLLDYCDCIEEKYLTQDIVDELVYLVSVATCWSQEPCETFLNSTRREVIDIKDCLCDCDIVEFSPFYYPFDPGTASFTLVKQEGIEETIIPITREEFNYSMVDGVFRIKPPLPSCDCQPMCECKADYKLLVEYDAGFFELPECMLPLFCEAVQYIIERRKCDCSECQECTNYDDDRIELLIPNAASITNQLKYYFVTALSEQYKRQLSQISLCKRRKRLWGIVV